MPIPIAQPHFGEEEQAALKATLNNAWLGPNGPEVLAFEKELEDYFGGDCHVLATNSGTSALHLALLTLGLSSGDLVLVQSFGYAAAAFAVRYVGAEPVFIGSENRSWNVDPHALELALVDLNRKGILERVKAFIPMHTYGLPAALKRLKAILEPYGIPIIEDAAEAMGSRYFGQAAGSLGTMGVLSFNANKIMSTGGGGALICKDFRTFSRAKHLANQAKLQGPNYLHTEIGYNYAMNSMAAALGRIQLRKLDLFLQRRKSLAQAYASHYANFLEFQKPLEGASANYWLIAAKLKQEYHYKTLMEQEDFELKAAFKPLHLQAPFQGCWFYGTSKICDELSKALCFPSGYGFRWFDLQRFMDRIFLS